MYLKLGKIVGTHGIKGELRIKSDFEKKELVFKKDFIIYFGTHLENHKIMSYRVHKGFDMVTIDDFNNINEVLKYKGLEVFIKQSDLDLKNDEVIINELIGYNVYFNDEKYGKIIDFVYNKVNNLLLIKNKEEYYIPYHMDFIEKIDKNNKNIYLKNVEGLVK